jgi:hypothetical protein
VRAEDHPLGEPRACRAGPACGAPGLVVCPGEQGTGDGRQWHGPFGKMGVGPGTDGQYRASPEGWWLAIGADGIEPDSSPPPGKCEYREPPYAGTGSA